ncbi:MAG: Proteasome endopeptidase complex [Candidatus Parvarchaeum acidiphilum ARMAN-4]|jgi:proteasome alpha subunit|uniref:Proteasome endopeptidase complex n=2 Tax=Parvarchaeum acidiphilum TaxID=662759 RepID=D2EG62_PARA4|nr:MAG: Proteasome endopeptidase complex [Candidatus Parvarchaeum acidiphilum ARMAN-4]EGD71844.1 MAG: Proteasome endopeptidase complex [Candidatus Parvarchaeum acidiphilum ARMAN-4_'5-way FS']
MEPPGDLMGYDRAITLFNPDGRILQVEYAKRTVSQGFAAVGLTGKGCIVFVADRKAHELEKLVIPESIEKIFQIDVHMAAAISGMIADGRTLIDKAQNNAQEYKMTYNQPADILLVVKGISTEMQALTQYGGARPFGVSILFGGIKDNKTYLYMLDPSGTFFQYRAIAIGGNSDIINKTLEKEYKADMDVEELIDLGMRTIKSDESKNSPERFEIAIVDKDGFRKLSREEITKYIK